MMNKRGQKFREWREAKGLSQRQVADALDIQKSSISQWENGRTMPLKTKRHKLAALYNIDVGDIDNLLYYFQRKKRKNRKGTCIRCGFEQICKILGYDGLPMLCEEPEDYHIQLMRGSGVLELFEQFRQKYQTENNSASNLQSVENGV